MEPAASSDDSAQQRLDELRQSRDTKAGGSEEEAKKAGSAKGRLGSGKAARDYTLLHILKKQRATHQPPKVDKPEFPPTPPPPGAQEVADSSAAGQGMDEDHGDPEFLQVNVTHRDTCFSPDTVRGQEPNNPNPNLPASFDPSIPPPNINKSTSIQDSQASSSDPRVIVESVVGKAATPPEPLVEADLVNFRVRMEFCVDKKNDELPPEAPPIINMIPWIERGKIILVPADKTSGQFFIDIINEGELKIRGRTLRAGWNLDLPEMALITLRYETYSDRHPQVLVECPKKGLARMNGWAIDPNGPKEISYYDSNADEANKAVKFTKVVASRRICQLIQQQQGHVWISGGQATARWRNKPLTPDNEVHYDFQ